MVFKDKLIEVKSDCNLSVTEMSRLCGISKENMSMYLSGKRVPKIETRLSIARTFNFNHHELMDVLDISLSEEDKYNLILEYIDEISQELKINVLSELVN